MDHSVIDRSSPPRRRRRPPPPPTWACENCATSNAGRRKRCTDCGTSRD